MIVVIGSPSYRPSEGTAADGIGGLAASIAAAAATAGSAVQFVAKVGDDGAGDALVLALGRGGVGHVAVLRDAAHGTPLLVEAASAVAPDELQDDASVLTGEDEALGDDDGEALVLPRVADLRPRLEPADLELALRYLTDFAVIVAADPLDDASAGVVVGAASFAGAHVVAIVPPGGRPPPAFADATVLERPPSDPDGAFARVVADYAVALEAGSPPGDAFRLVVARDGWEVASA